MLNRNSERIPGPDLSLFIPIYRDLSGFHQCGELQLTNMGINTDRGWGWL